MEALSLLPFLPRGDSLDQAISLAFCEDRCVCNHRRDDVWVHVGRWSSVFNVALSVVCTGLGWDAN